MPSDAAETLAAMALDLPASKRYHHVEPFGLVDHSVQVANLVPLDHRRLALLHDIGKIHQMRFKCTRCNAEMNGATYEEFLNAHAEIMASGGPRDLKSHERWVDPIVKAADCKSVADYRERVHRERLYPQLGKPPAQVWFPIEPDANFLVAYAVRQTNVDVMQIDYATLDGIVRNLMAWFGGRSDLVKYNCHSAAAFLRVLQYERSLLGRDGPFFLVKGVAL